MEWLRVVLAVFAIAVVSSLAAVLAVGVLYVLFDGRVPCVFSALGSGSYFGWVA